MTSDPESRLFDFALSNREPATEEEMIVIELYAALATEGVPLRLRRPPVVERPFFWRGNVPAAAAAVLVIALLGASFSAFVPRRDENNRYASVPPVVLGIASPSRGTACDLTGDIPFFSGISVSPIDETVVLLTPEEELVLICGSDQNVLLTGVKVAGPTMTPHVMIAVTENANHLLHIVSGELITIPNGGPQAQSSIGQQSFGPWVLAASTTDISMASIYELTSMTEIPIVAKDGKSVESAKLDNAVVSSSHDHVAISIPNDPNSINSALAGLFITNLSGDSRFVAFEDTPMPRQIAISPDGATIATSSFDGSAFGGVTTIRLLNTEDGAVEQSWDFPTRDQSSELTWLRDGSMLILTDGTKLLGIAPESPREGIRVFATGEIMQGIFLTPDPRVVAIAESSTSSNSTPATQTLFVNVDTNAIVTQPGSDMWSSPNLSATRTTLVLAQPLLLPAEETPSLLIVEAATGDVIGKLDQDISPDNGFLSSTWGYGEGDIVTMAFGPDSMWLLVDADGNATLQHIVPPPLEDADYQAVSLVITPGGSMALRTFEPFSAWFKTPDTDEWIQVDLPDPASGGPILPGIQFVPGEH